MIPVLMYHHIAPTAGPHTVTVQNFCDQLNFLKSSGTRTLSLSEFDEWRAGKLRIKGKAVLLTFDDAWLDNWVWALPLLKEFEIPAVFFVVTSWPGEGEPRWKIVKGGCGWQTPDHSECMALGGTDRGDEVSMRWSELLAARDTGLIELASHSHRHGSWWDTPGPWEYKMSALESDLDMSREALSNRVGVVSSHFCWPKGFISPRSINIARRMGFSTQFSTLRGGNVGGRNNNAAERIIRRIDAENRGPEWLRNRLFVYSSPVLSEVLGLAHQNLHRSRMAKRFPDAPQKEFDFPLFVPI